MLQNGQRLVASCFLGLLVLGCGLDSIGSKSIRGTVTHPRSPSKTFDFRLVIPRSWVGKTSAETHQGGRFFTIYFDRPPRSMVVSVGIYTAEEWQTLSSTREEQPFESVKLADANSYVLAYGSPLDMPYSGPDAQLFARMVREIPKVMETFRVESSDSAQ
jgi:hypothetical protein